MPIHQTAEYQVKASGVEKVKRAIQEFVPYVQAKELGTRLYMAWQQESDPTRFLHFFIFDNAAAQQAHSESQEVKRFEAQYSLELVGKDVVFTDFVPVATNQEAEAGAILRRFYEAVVARDLTTARQYLDDTFLFVGLFETYRSADDYLAALTQLLSVTVRLDVKTIIAQGNDAAVFFELETRAPVKATTLVAERHQIRNGRIAYVESAFDGRAFEPMFTAGKRT